MKHKEHALTNSLDNETLMEEWCITSTSTALTKNDGMPTEERHVKSTGHTGNARGQTVPGKKMTTGGDHRIVDRCFECHLNALRFLGRETGRHCREGGHRQCEDQRGGAMRPNECVVQSLFLLPGRSSYPGLGENLVA